MAVLKLVEARREKCVDVLPTLSAEKENIIESIDQWNDFIRDNPFFVLGMGNSHDEYACDSEPMLDQLSYHLSVYSHEFVKISYKKDNGQRMPIKIARMDR